MLARVQSPTGASSAASSLVVPAPATDAHVIGIDARQLLLLILSVVCGATAVIFIKSSTSHPTMLAAVRLLLAGLILLPLAIRGHLRNPARDAVGLLRCAAPAAVLLAIHFVSWADGARRTPAANSSLIVNLVPVAVPILMLLFLKHSPRRHELLGTVVALAGVAVLTFPSLRLDAANLRGDLTCIGSMIALAGYLIFARGRPATIGLWPFVVTVYSLAGMLCAIVVTALGKWTMPDGHEVLMLLGLAAIPTVVGHSALAASAQAVGAQVTSVFNLGQFIFAGLFAWVLLGELPSVWLAPASVLVVAGALLSLGVRLRR